MGMSSPAADDVVHEDGLGLARAAIALLAQSEAALGEPHPVEGVALRGYVEDLLEDGLAGGRAPVLQGLRSLDVPVAGAVARLRQLPHFPHPRS
jgi:hypothetical protein